MTINDILIVGGIALVVFGAIVLFMSIVGHFAEPPRARVIMIQTRMMSCCWSSSFTKSEERFEVEPE
jgi:hypothetical protein